MFDCATTMIIASPGRFVHYLGGFFASRTLRALTLV